MANTLRICSPGDLPGSLEYDGKKFTGAIGYLANEFCHDIVRHENATVSIYSRNEGMGELIDESSGAFDGCLGRLQRNESDMMLREITYPLTATGITQGDMITDSVVQFVSVYRAKPGQTPAQMISSFKSFDLTVWIACLVTLIAGCLLLIISGWIRKMPRSVRRCKRVERPTSPSHQYKIYQVATHMSATGSMNDPSSVSLTILFITMSLFSLLVLFYFGSIIKTELVVVEPPDYYRSYQDLLDHNVSITFIRILDTYAHFKFAPEGSLEKRLWDASIARIGDERVLFEASETDMSLYARSMISRSLVYVTESLWIGMALNELCPVVANQDAFDKFSLFFAIKTIKVGYGYPIRSQDPNAKVQPKGFVFRKKVDGMLRRVRGAVIRLFETGLVVRSTVFAERMNYLKNILQWSTANGTDYETVEKCQQSILIMHDPEVHGVNVANMSGLLGLVLCLYAVASFFLFVEHLARL